VSQALTASEAAEERVTRLRIRPQAQADIDTIAAFFRAEYCIDSGIFVLDAADRGLSQLLEHPRLGPRLAVLDPGLSGLHSWPVPEIGRFLVLYFATQDVVDVLRIVDSRRELDSVLAGVPVLP
jgi:plasmid stabilization system protein ParE